VKRASFSQGLLDYVLRLMMIAYQPQRNPVGHREVPPDKDFVGIEIAFLGPGDQVCVVNFREIRRACSRGERRLPGRAATGRIRRSGRETRRDPRHEQRGVDCGL